MPAQVAFLLIKASMRKMPVWLSMGLWHMSRNPLQYTWLVLLLVMATGVGVLSTTVGGTLERSKEHRIRYDTAADLRISGVSGFVADHARKLKDTYVGTPGVAEVSLAFRGTGSVGQGQVQVLALEPREFAHVSWYREDFSERPLRSVMGRLQPDAQVDRVAIPEGATSIGVWIKPLELHANISFVYRFLSLWMVIEDGVGDITTVSLGNLGPTEWHQLNAAIPSDLQPPLYLLSVQVFEPGVAAGGTSFAASSGTVGTILLDDMQVTAGIGEEELILEDFEIHDRWTPIVTSVIASDIFSFTDQDAYRGQKAGVFSFGSDRNMLVRGIYQSTTGGPIPVVVSSSLAGRVGIDVGDPFIARISGRLVPLVVRDTVDYFPTMNPDVGFILADLESLLTYLNMLGPTSVVEPNELYIQTNEGADQVVKNEVHELAVRFVDIEERASLLESVRQDPFITAGWEGNGTHLSGRSAPGRRPRVRDLPPAVRGPKPERDGLSTVPGAFAPSASGPDHLRTALHCCIGFRPGGLGRIPDEQIDGIALGRDRDRRAGGATLYTYDGLEPCAADIPGISGNPGIRAFRAISRYRKPGPSKYRQGGRLLVLM